MAWSEEYASSNESEKRSRAKQVNKGLPRDLGPWGRGLCPTRFCRREYRNGRGHYVSRGSLHVDTADLSAVAGVSVAVAVCSSGCVNSIKSLCEMQGALHTYRCRHQSEAWARTAIFRACRRHPWLQSKEFALQEPCRLGSERCGLINQELIRY